jgi:hypothetical protein
MPTCSDPYLTETHQHIWRALFDLTLNFGLYSAALMAEGSEGPRGLTEKAKWTPAEVTALVDYLHEHCAERAEAGNFKDATYNAAATALRPLYNNNGAIKTGKMVAYKWGMVGTDLMFSFAYTYSITHSSKLYIMQSRFIIADQESTGITLVVWTFKV